MSHLLTELVVEAINGDDSGKPEWDTQVIARNYRMATPEQRAFVDDIFISLCGWSLDTLIMRAEGTDDEAEDVWIATEGTEREVEFVIDAEGNRVEGQS